MYGLIKATSETLGIMSLLHEWDCVYYGQMFSDASAALGIIQRRGLGKLRHIDTSFLWIQEVNAQRAVLFDKVAGAENPADICTKGVGQELILKHTVGMDLCFEEGRASMASELHVFYDSVIENRCRRYSTSSQSRSRMKNAVSKG